MGCIHSRKTEEETDLLGVLCKDLKGMHHLAAGVPFGAGSSEHHMEMRSHLSPPCPLQSGILTVERRVLEGGHVLPRGYLPTLGLITLTPLKG